MTSTNTELIILDQTNGRRIFAGIIKEVTKKFYKTDGWIEDCLVQDYTRYIDDIEDGVTETYSSQTEKAILQDLFSTYCSNILVGNLVIIGNTTSITFQNYSLRQAIDALADANSRVWYVDYHKCLHYFTLGDESAPFGLSDSPNNVNTFRMGKLEYTEDLVNSEIRGSLVCFDPGLFSGMEVEITNAKLGLSAEPFLIHEVSTKLIGGDLLNADPEMEYTIQFSDQRVRGKEKITEEVEEIEEIVEVLQHTIPKTILFAIASTLGTAVNASFGIPVPHDMTCQNVYINVKTAPSGGSICVDVNLDGTSIFTNQGSRPTILSGATTGVSGTPDVNTFLYNQILSVDIDSVGTATAGADLVASIRCTMEII